MFVEERHDGFLYSVRPQAHGRASPIASSDFSPTTACFGPVAGVDDRTAVDDLPALLGGRVDQPLGVEALEEYLPFDRSFDQGCQSRRAWIGVVDQEFGVIEQMVSQGLPLDVALHETDPNKTDQRIIALGDSTGIPVLNLTRIFTRAYVDEGRLLFHRLEDQHWNAAGHELATAELAKFLDQRGLLPAKR